MSRGPGKPRVFVASSKESEPIGLAIQRNLADLQVTLWSQGVFRLTTSSLDSLLAALADFDFAIFVFKPEDVLIQRSKRKAAVRDNLIFELGLFLGRLGQRRSFIVAPAGLDQLHLPSDLKGITLATFDAERPDGNLDAALAPACTTIRRAIESLAPPPRHVASSVFGQRIDEHEGIRSANPVTLAIDLLPTSHSIKRDVETFLTSRGWTMPIEELTLNGIAGPGDVETFVERLKEKRLELSHRGATEVHLFYAGPGAAAALVGVIFDNWIPVKVYQKAAGSGELYEYWAPLVKT